MEMEITFPGGVAVDARFKGVEVHTDQPPPLGGGNAPSPFDLFLASIGTCAGFYALRFCQERQIATAGLKIGLSFERNPEEEKLFAKITIHVGLPDGFPPKYRAAIVRTINQCTVKRNIVEPPAFEVVTG